MAQKDDTIAKTGPQTPCRPGQKRAFTEKVDELDALPTPLKIQKKDVELGYVLIVYCVIMHEYCAHRRLYASSVGIHSVFASSPYPIRDIVYQPVDTIEPV